MALIYCTDHKDEHNDQGLHCFVNLDGRHVNPRHCLCGGYHPSGEERKISSFTEQDLACVKVKPRQGQLTLEQYRKVVKQKYGRANPACPIEDEHEPITN